MSKSPNPVVTGNKVFDDAVAISGKVAAQVSNDSILGKILAAVDSQSTALQGVDAEFSTLEKNIDELSTNIDLMINKYAALETARQALQKRFDSLESGSSSEKDELTKQMAQLATYMATIRANLKVILDKVTGSKSNVTANAIKGINTKIKGMLTKAEAHVKSAKLPAAAAAAAGPTPPAGPSTPPATSKEPTPAEALAMQKAKGPITKKAANKVGTGGRKRTKRRRTKRRHSKRGKKVAKKTRVRHSKKGGKRSRRMQRGGFGPGACPTVGKQWNAATGGNYFKLGTPIGVGATPVYPGNVSPSPQHTSPQGPVAAWSPLDNVAHNAAKIAQAGGSSVHPWTPMPLLNAYRGTLGGAQNLWRQYQGLRPLPSPQPWSQHQQEL